LLAGAALALQACATYAPPTFSKKGGSAAAYARASKECTAVGAREAKKNEEWVKRMQTSAIIGGGLGGAIATSGDDPYGIKTSAYRLCMEKRGYCSDTPASLASQR
jgi:hypothetical protein